MKKLNIAIPTVIRDDDQVATNHKDMCNFFAEYFKMVFINSDITGNLNHHFGHS